MKQIVHFKGLHDGNCCWVCGTGPSLWDLIEGEKYKLFTSIGVNAIGMYFTPDYLVVVDRVQIMNNWDNRPELKERAQYIHNSNADFVFSKFNNDYLLSQWIPIRLEPLVDYDPEYALNQNKMFSQSTATVTAISLAIYMGFNQIGVIGFDLVRHQLENHRDNLNEACEKIVSFCHKKGVEILNVSSQSLIDTLPKCSVEQFIDWYGGIK